VARSVPQAEILAASRQVFAQHGYSGATLERIAAACGVSRVTLHRRGIDKDTLLGELVIEATEEYRQRLWPALTGDGSAADRLEQALGSLCAMAEQNIGLLVALSSQVDDVFHEDEGGLTRGVFTEPLERLLCDGLDDGSLRATDPAESATVLFNLAGWGYVHLRTGHGWPPERARHAVVEPLLHGLLSGEPTTATAKERR
jgi:AcrR family transcriptional regulator